MVYLDRVRLWAEELERTTKPQTTGHLHATSRTIGDSFCCLGIACEVAIANGLEVDVSGYHSMMVYDNSADILPTSVADWYGIDADPLLDVEDEYADSASALNDDEGFTFVQIAAAIRNTYLEEA